VIRHTKIVATLGPSSNRPATIDALVAAGVDVFRLNFSHGTHESHATVFRSIRDAATRSGRHIGILQDLSGPKIRTGPLKDGQPIQLRDGEELRLAAGDEQGDSGRVFTPYEPLIASAQPGARLLLDDGRIELRVVGRDNRELITTVVHGGLLGEHKGINAPGVALPAAAITPKDESDLRFGLQLGVDLVALSFVQTADDVHRARTIVHNAGADLPLIAKIERPEAVRHLQAIVDAADGVMVARGDLGLECPLEQVPRIQKEIIRCARKRARPVIVATQVLESMRSEPRPTRAEVSDAAAAVDQGADAIMLAGETAVGEYPVRAVETLAAVICDAEHLPADEVAPDVDPIGSRHARALCEAAVTLATSGQADAIVAVTSEGKTARLLSSLRPRALILAVPHLESLANRLAILWGVTPLFSPVPDPHALNGWLQKVANLPPNAVVVFINVSPDLSRQDANYLNVQKLQGKAER
jgi:pyruvate kinase